MLDLMPGERVLTEAIGGQHRIWLTNERVVQQVTSGVLQSRTQTTAIPLSNIESVESYRRRRRFWLFVAVVFAVLGSIGLPASIVLLVPAAIAFGLWRLTATTTARIHGTRSTIEFFAKGMRAEEVDEFLHEVQAARAAAD